MKKLPLSLLLLVVSFFSFSAKCSSSQVNKKENLHTQNAINTTSEFTNNQEELLAEMNLLRSNPQEYVNFLEELLKTFNGNSFKTPDGIGIVSFEGKKPVEEAIKVLKKLNPLPELKIAEGLAKAAKDHVKDLEKHNKTGHRGTDGSFPTQRANRYGIAPSGVSENITYKVGGPRDIVLMMLIDDGNESRSHRKTILDPQLKVVGFAIGENKIGGRFCVLKLAETFYDKKSVSN